jgi:phenylalanine ammonia-lyase
LAQDRYSLRSAPQWIGPQLEDLLLADQQISIELNSSCDNPLVDSDANDIYYGCNFQAAAVTSAMEKARLALQMFGRILFAQSTEMIDVHLSGGLPANLAADNPNISFTMKGVDINMAAYMAELSYLANPMSSHVQAAEMHNQSVNSMAFASARISQDAIDVLTNMCACSVFVVSQALDLRALHMAFIADATKALASTIEVAFSTKVADDQLHSLQTSIQAHIDRAWGSTAKLSLHDRCASLIDSAVPIVVSHVGGAVYDINKWKEHAVGVVWKVWKKTFASFSAEPHTSRILGAGSRVLYDFVRITLGVPFHEGILEHPTIDSQTFHGRPKKTVGGWISIIRESIQCGSIYDDLLALAEGLLPTAGVTNGTNGKSSKLCHEHTNGEIREWEKQA